MNKQILALFVAGMLVAFATVAFSATIQVTPGEFDPDQISFTDFNPAMPAFVLFEMDAPTDLGIEGFLVPDFAASAGDPTLHDLVFIPSWAVASAVDFIRTEQPSPSDILDWGFWDQNVDFIHVGAAIPEVPLPASGLLLGSALVGLSMVPRTRRYFARRTG